MIKLSVSSLMQYSNPQNPDSLRIEIGFLHMHAPCGIPSVTAKMTHQYQIFRLLMIHEKLLHMKLNHKTWLHFIKQPKCKRKEYQFANTSSTYLWHMLTGTI